MYLKCKRNSRLVQLLCALDDIDDSPERESNKEKGVCDDGVVVVF